MDKNIYNTCLIGTGYWGSIIFNTLNKITKKKILTFDINKKNNNLLKKKFGNKVLLSKNLKEIIENKNIKNVILATHPSTNYKLAKKLITNKKNIFIEKPIVKDQKKLKELISLAKKNKVIMMGGYIYLYNSYIRKIKKILDSKVLGKIKFIEIQRKNLGPIRNEVDAHMDLGSHDISILFYFFGFKLKILNISTKKILKKNISDISTMNIKIKDIFCDIHSSWLNPTKERKILIIGNKKMLIFDEMENKYKLKIYNNYAYYPDILKFKNNYISKKARVYKGKTKNIFVKETDTLKNELNHFIKKCESKTRPITDGAFCLNILRVLS